MAATVGELVVNLKARTGAFTKGIQASGRQVSTFGSKVQAAGKRLAAFSSTMIGVASVGGLVAMVKKNMDLMDSTGKLADRIGITTEALQGLRHAAELTGAGADTLDAGLTTMAKRLGEAARGAGAAVPALKLLGLSIQDLIQKSPDQQFIAIAEAFRKVSTKTEQAAAAANIFSKGNMALINTLAEGREGIERMTKDAEALGIAFSDEAAKGAAAANDAITNLIATLNGQSLEKSGGLISQIEKAANAINWMVQGLDKLKQAAPWLMPVLDPFQQLQNDWAKLGAEWKKTQGRTFGVIDRPAAAAAGAAGPGAPDGVASQIKALANVSDAIAAIPRAITAREAQARENLQRMGERLADRMSMASSLIDQQLRGGDGGFLQLRGAATPGSPEAYSAFVGRGLQGTAQKTDEQILRIVKQQLDEERKANRKRDEMLEKLDFGMGEVKIR